jgi:hypothetical protein
MNGGIGWVVIVGVLALCAIVGIYYCWVRKIHHSEDAIEHSRPAAPQ